MAPISEMPHAGEIWETLLYGLTGTASGPFAARRDRILAALREVGFDPAGAAELDDDALEAMPAHRLVIIASDGADDDFHLAAIPDDDLDGELRAALDRLDGETIDVGTAGNFPELWSAWVTVALATGARDRDTLAVAGDPLPLDDDRIAAVTDRWAEHHIALGRGGRLDGAALDKCFSRVTFVMENV
jgi:hypothetical protein